MRPVGNAITTIANFLQQFLGTLSGGLNPGSSTWLVDQSVYFLVLSVLILFVRFVWEITKENRTRKAGEQITTLIGALMFLGPRLFLVPLVCFASAIPGVIGRMAPNAFPATWAAAAKIAEAGDGFVDQGSTYWSTTIQGNVSKVLNIGPEDLAKLSPEERQYTASIQANYRNAANAVETSREAYQSALTAKASPTVLANAKGRNDDAQQILGQMTKALVQHAKSIAPRLDDTAGRQAQAQRELPILQAIQSKAMDGPLALLLPMGKLGSTTARVGLSAYEAQARATAEGRAGWADVGAVLIDFFTHIGFYACCLPALLGIIAACVITLKEAVSILQFGAKVDVLRGLALTIAAMFAPAFMLCFLFPKAEQFGWKFLSFLFSAYFAAFGVSYVAGVVVRSGIGPVVSVISTLAAEPTGSLPRAASQALFFGSLRIGITALGCALVLGFIREVVSSSVKTAQGPFQGNFSV